MPRHALVSILLTALVLAAAGCSKPLVEGPQITKVPGGFMFDLNASGAALHVGDRAVADQRGYFSPGPDDTHASIMITEYPGAVTRDEAAQARAAAQAYYPYMVYGPLEPLRIDGCPAWGWTVTQAWKGGTSVRYQAVVSYDDPGVTYALEFYSSQPRFQDTEMMKETLQTFRVKHAGVNYGAVGLAVVLGLGFLAAFRRISRG